MTVGSSLDYTLASEAESAEAALAQSPSIPPDIVIADLRLPNMSGADLLRQIKAAPAGHRGRDHDRPRFDRIRGGSHEAGRL